MMSSPCLSRTFLFFPVLLAACFAPVQSVFSQGISEPIETPIEAPIETPVEVSVEAPIIDDLDFLTGERAIPEPEMEDLSIPTGSTAPSDYEDMAEELSEKAPPVVNTTTGSIPSLPVLEEPDDNIFFDAEALVPTGEMGVRSGPRKVNPRLQPASKLIVVRKNHESSSREAGLVAAERALSLGRYAAAIEMYNGLYQRNRNDPNIIMGRAVALQNLGRNDESVLAYEELLELYPNNVEAQVNMLGLIGQRYPAVALQRLMELRDDMPAHVGVVAQIAVVQAALGNNNDALQFLGMAASMEPNNASHVFNIAVMADRAGKKEEAVKYYEQALEIDTVYGGGRSIPRDSVFERLARLR